MDEQARIDVLLKRVQWIEEDIPSIAGDAASGVLTVVPSIRYAFPTQAITLLESFATAFYEGIDDAIKENELETQAM